MPRGLLLKEKEMAPVGYKQTGSVTRASGKKLRVFEPPAQSQPQGLSGRTAYRDLLIQKHGDPDEEERNLSDSVNAIVAGNEKVLFKHVFGGQSSNIQSLDPRARKYWNQAVSKYRRQETDKARQNIKRERTRIGLAMDAYDKYAGRAENVKAKPKDFTPSQMANLRKSAYGEASKELNRRRENMELFTEKDKKRVPYTRQQEDELVETLSGQYMQRYTGSDQRILKDKQGLGLGKIVSRKRNKGTGEIVYLDANNNVVKTELDGKTFYKIGR